MNPSITPEQRETFERRGILCLGRILPPGVAEAARGAALRRLARLGLWQGGAWRLDAVPRPVSPATGIKTNKVIGNKHPEFAALFDAPALQAAVDDLMDGREVHRRIHRQPQALFTLPNIDVWELPGGWHTDGPRLASGRKPGVQVFVMLEHALPRGGGTLAVAGSNRLASEAGRFMRARDLRKSLLAEPFFRHLWLETPERWPADRPLPVGLVGDVPVEVVEMTGEVGDVWVTDLYTLHSGAPNSGQRPRLMITNRYLAREVVREVAEGHGWV